jgi:hypothetical protein
MRSFPNEMERSILGWELMEQAKTSHKFKVVVEELEGGGDMIK